MCRARGRHVHQYNRSHAAIIPTFDEHAAAVAPAGAQRQKVVSQACPGLVASVLIGKTEAWLA